MKYSSPHSRGVCVILSVSFTLFLLGFVYSRSVNPNPRRISSVREISVRQSRSIKICVSRVSRARKTRDRIAIYLSTSRTWLRGRCAVVTPVNGIGRFVFSFVHACTRVTNRKKVCSLMSRCVDSHCRGIETRNAGCRERERERGRERAFSRVTKHARKRIARYGQRLASYPILSGCVDIAENDENSIYVISKLRSLVSCAGNSFGSVYSRTSRAKLRYVSSNTDDATSRFHARTENWKSKTQPKLQPPKSCLCLFLRCPRYRRRRRSEPPMRYCDFARNSRYLSLA